MAQVPQISVLDSAGTPRDVATITAMIALIGEVLADPTANTLLARLKDLATLTGEVDPNPTANTLQDRLKALATTLGEVLANPTANTVQDRLKTMATVTSALGVLIGEVQASPTANTMQDRLKTLATLATALNALIGEVQANPTPNTALDRLKTVGTLLTTLNGLIGEVQVTPTANTALDRLKTLATLATALNALVGEVQASPTANTVLDRLKAINTSLTTLITGPVITAPQSAAADVAVTITRSANTTAYPALSVVTNAAGGAIQFTNLGKAGGASIVITGASLEYDVSALPPGIGSFNLHLYASSPTSIADNAAFDIPIADRQPVYLGYFNIPAMTDFGATCYSEINNINKQIRATGANIFGYLQTVGGFTPASGEVFKVTLHRIEV